MLVFAAATMGWFLTRSRLGKRGAAAGRLHPVPPGLLVGHGLSAAIEVDPAEIVQAAADVPDGGSLRLEAQGLSIEGDEVQKTVMLPMGPAGPGEARLTNAGLEVREEEGRVFIDQVGFGSAAEKAGLDFDFEITSVLGVNDRPPKELMWLPALVVLGLIVWLQRRRGPSLAPATVTVAAGGA